MIANRYLLAAAVLFGSVFLQNAGFAAEQSEVSVSSKETEVKSPADEQSGNTAISKESEVKNFDRGYEMLQKSMYRQASIHFYRYLKKHSPNDSDYNWAEFFLGVSLKKTGLTHAAVDIFAHLVKRNPDPKITAQCIKIFEEITRTIPYDNDLIVNEIIAGVREYEFLTGEMADFVHFRKGLFDWEHGFFDWGDKYFSRIEPESYYYYKFQYVKALSDINDDKIDDAIVLLRQILSSSVEAEDLKDETRQTLARLLYEKGIYKDSISLYLQIKKPKREQAQNFLEMAWNKFMEGKTQKAMGLLFAYNAPDLTQFHTPEYYMLRSFIFKELCHYRKAVSVVSEFKALYSESLNNIYNRGEAADDHALLSLLITKKEINKVWKFINLLEHEKKKSKFSDKNLTKNLEKIYDLQLKQSAGILQGLITEEYENMADSLLKYEEEAYLIEYEIGLDMYRRIYRSDLAEEADPEDKEEKKFKAVYPFQGEFWNDELIDYEVDISSKCKSMEEWDIFIK